MFNLASNFKYSSKRVGRKWILPDVEAFDEGVNVSSIFNHAPYPLLLDETTAYRIERVPFHRRYRSDFLPRVKRSEEISFRIHDAGSTGWPIVVPCRGIGSPPLSKSACHNPEVG